MEIFCKTCKYFDNPCKCVDCQEDDGHLYEKADWVKRYDEKIKVRVVDEFMETIKEHQYILSDRFNSTDWGLFTIGLEQIAEQIKEQKNDN